MFGLGVPELLLILCLGLFLFGNQLPKLARSLGKGIVEFRRGVSGLEDDMRC
jgi:sec-independent protein translocase protein TatA